MFPSLPCDVTRVSYHSHDHEWMLYVYSKKDFGWLGIATFRSEREARTAEMVIRAALEEFAETANQR
jgi:hypothetical protein